MIELLLGVTLWVSLLSELHPRVNGEGAATFLFVLLITIIFMSILMWLFTVLLEYGQLCVHY